MKNTITPEFFNFMLDNSVLNRISDISWAYKFDNGTFVLDFFQNEDGKNHIEEFSTIVNGVKFDLMASDEQIKLMWGKLNNTPYHDEKERDSPFSIDYNELYGVEPKNFY